MYKKLLIIVLVFLFINSLNSLGVFKTFAYGDCDYSEGVYGSDCIDEITDNDTVDNGTADNSDGTSTSDENDDSIEDVEDTENTEDISVTDYKEDQIYYVLRILDKDGNPVSGVKIVIEEIGIDEVTDENGIIDIGYADRGDYTIKLSKDGQEWEKTISLGSVENLDISLDDIHKGGIGMTTICLLSLLGLLIFIGALWWFLGRDDDNNENLGSFKNSSKIKTRV